MARRRRALFGDPGQPPNKPWFQALLRVGLSPKERGKWLLEFAEQDLERALPETLDKYGQQMLVFATTWGKELLEPLPDVAFGGPIPTPKIHQIHRLLKSSLNKLRTGRLTLPFGVTNSLIWTQEGSIVPASPGNVEQAFFSAVFRTLEAIGPHLRVCLCSPCHRFFVATGRQRYCRPQCSQRVRTWHFKTTHPEKVRAWKRTSYVRRQRKKYGPKVKVGVRTRRGAGRMHGDTTDQKRPAAQARK